MTCPGRPVPWSRPSQGTEPGLSAGTGGESAREQAAAAAAARILLDAGNPADADVVRACTALVIEASSERPDTDETRQWAGRVMFRGLLRRGFPEGMPTARAAAGAVLDALARARPPGEGPGACPPPPPPGST